MNRREFMQLLGVSTTTIVMFGSGVWTPRPVFVVGNHYDFLIMDDVLSGKPATFQEFIECVTNYPLSYNQKAMIEYLEANGAPRQNTLGR